MKKFIIFIDQILYNIYFLTLGAYLVLTIIPLVNFILQVSVNRYLCEYIFSKIAFKPLFIITLIIVVTIHIVAEKLRNETFNPVTPNVKNTKLSAITIIAIIVSIILIGGGSNKTCEVPPQGTDMERWPDSYTNPVIDIYKI
mgnify:CR=1 FL=1